jgi:hypothetical protein
MSTTPLWVPLLVASLGIVGTVAGTVSGVVYAQRQADRRDALSWERERKREEQRWAREDLARTFEHRRNAYVEFYESLRDTTFMIYNHKMGLSQPVEGQDEPPFDFQLPTYRKLQHLEVYATPFVVQPAKDAYDAAWKWGVGARFDQVDEKCAAHQQRYDELEIVLLDTVRMDLGIPVLAARGPSPPSRGAGDPHGGI